MHDSSETLEIISYLEGKGKDEGSFSKQFPRIHHFYEKADASSSLEAHKQYCKTHETMQNSNNFIVYARLKYIKAMVEAYIEETGKECVSSMKFQELVKKAVVAIPFEHK